MNTRDAEYRQKVEDQCIIFYSLHPNDQISKKFIELLSKNPLIERQFIKVCVYPNYQNIKIPERIVRLNKIPVLVASGFPEPILGQNALSWLENHALVNNKSNGLDYGSVENTSFSGKFSSLTGEFEQTDYNQFFNNDYNLGFGKDERNVNEPFSNVSDANRILTYDDADESKKGMSDKMNAKLSQMKFQRDNEVPQSPQRAGGMDDINLGMNIPPSPGFCEQSGQMSRNIPQIPNMSQMQQMRNMPIMPQMPQQQMRNIPQIPQTPPQTGGVMNARPYADRINNRQNVNIQYPSPINMPGGPNGYGHYTK